ncbi:hypothetical protein AN189_13145, partial [Loktanella sp. 3ANDIMAR09]|uniref:phage tail protein I n=1 Tax=Loktanella sp. 3ANDIMAR09 TaxID=1225657 RepID=UPI0006F9A816
MTLAVSDDELRAISPAPIQGRRDQGFLQSLARLHADQDLSRFVVQDAYACPASALPALIAEYSVEEFITPNLSEARVRDIVANAWALHEAKGYDSGVRLALSLAGVTAEIIPWYAEDPPAAPNTHRLIFEADSDFWGSEPIGGPLSFGRIRGLVEASKRFSQETAYQIRTTGTQRARAATGQRARLDATGILRPAVPVT